MARELRPCVLVVGRVQGSARNLAIESTSRKVAPVELNISWAIEKRQERAHLGRFTTARREIKNTDGARLLLLHVTIHERVDHLHQTTVVRVAVGRGDQAIVLGHTVSV